VKVDRSDEGEMVRRYQAGDREAGARLLEMHAGVISRIACSYLRTGIGREDMMQEARIGFLRGVSKYEDGHGAKLITHAAWWVRSACSAHMMDHATTIQVARTAQKSGASPAERLAAVLARSTERLDAPLGRPDLEGLTVADLVADEGPSPEDLASGVGEQGLLAAAITEARLKPRELELLRVRWLREDRERLTHEEIAKSWGITRQAVHQCEAKVFAKLRRILET